MRIHKQDLSWIIILIVSGFLFLNIFIPRNTQLKLSLKNDLPVTQFPPPAKTRSQVISEVLNKLERGVPAQTPPNHLELLGTIIGPPSLAFIHNLKTDIQRLYRINDFIEDLKVIGIMRGKVLLLGKEMVWELLLRAGSRQREKAGPAIFQDTSGMMVVDRIKVIKQIPKANELLKKIRISQVSDIETQKVKGFRIDNVPAGSIIEEAGIKSGDIIHSVQDKEIQSMRDAMQSLEQIRNLPLIKVILIRDNLPIILQYQIRN
jgi:type II secretory pathway component PulC